jgi:hypothetical protein
MEKKKVNRCAQCEFYRKSPIPAARTGNCLYIADGIIRNVLIGGNGLACKNFNARNARSARGDTAWKKCQRKLEEVRKMLEKS